MRKGLIAGLVVLVLGGAASFGGGVFVSKLKERAKVSNRAKQKKVVEREIVQANTNNVPSNISEEERSIKTYSILIEQANHRLRQKDYEAARDAYISALEYAQSCKYEMPNQEKIRVRISQLTEETKE